MSSTEERNGVPLMGFGTMEHADGSVKPDVMFEAVKKALEVGYRHIDTAELYQTQELVGKAIAESKIKREELFITSKLKGMPCGEYAGVKERAASMLKKMGLDRFDLLLMHWPGPDTADWAGSPEALASACSFEWFRQHVQQAWANMLRLKEEGLSLRVGVSNFYRAHLSELSRQFPTDPPAANQINIDALNHEKAFVEKMQKDGIAVIAYRPIAFVPAYAMAADMGDTTASVLASAASEAAYTSSQQLVLSWLMARGICVIPKSSSPPNIQANFDALSKVGTCSPHVLAELEGGSEMAAMCGGVDEYAAAVRSVAEEEEARAASGGGEA